MALLQRTLASNSIWIGTGQSSSNWGEYWTGDKALAVYSGSYPILYFQTSPSENTLYFSTNSAQSSIEFDSAYPLGHGYKVWNEKQTYGDGSTSSRWKAIFDDIWVRGSMNVWQFVINQIRATNGSLWVSDAAKATSVTSSGVAPDITQVYLTFDTGSNLPFVPGDIIRSKRFITTGSSTTSGISANWDIILIVGTASYTNYNVTASLGFTESGFDWNGFVNTSSYIGTEWVRMGHTASSNRQGAIYLTSNNVFGPFIDIYDSVSTVAQARGGAGGDVYTDSTKVRIGKLTGISTPDFGGQLQGYGLYATGNVYLKGKIVANQGGTISNWTIGADQLSSQNVHLHSGTETYLSFNATDWNQEKSIYIGSGSQGVRFGLSGSSNNYLWFSGSTLSIKTPNFYVDGTGNVSMSGTVSATSGLIGGWSIANNALYNGNVTMSATAGGSYLGFNTSTWLGTNGIYIGSGSEGPRFGVSSSNAYFWFSNSAIAISTSNFSAIGGNVTMSGNITAQTGNIGGWSLAPNQLYSGKVTLSSISGNSYLGIGSSEYDSTGIYIGSKSVEGNRLSLVSGNNKLLWDGSNLGITTSNFTLSGGNITAKGGTIAAWSIGADSMSATTALSSLILRNEPSQAWDIVDSGGYQYTWQDNAYFNWKGKYFSTGSSYDAGNSPWKAISNTSSVSSTGSVGQTNIGFTVSAAGMDKTLVTWNSSHPDNDKITALPGETIHIIINTMSVANITNVAGRVTSPFDLLQLNLINKTAGTTRSVLHSFLLPEIGQTTAYTQNEQSYPGVFATSFTNNSATGETYSILISVTSSIRGTVGNESLPNFNYNLVIKGLGVGSAKGYTELNSQGLLVYAGPSNFIKISTNQLQGGASGSNLGIIAVDTIVGGNTTYGYSGGGGSSGGIDGGGTSGTLSLWQDNNTIVDSIVSQQNGATVSVAGTISAPVYSGSGFIFDDVTSTYTAKVGNLPVGYNADNKSIKQILDDMLFFAAPSLTLTTNLTKTMQASETAETTLTDIGVTKQAPFKISSGARLATTFSCGANYKSVASLQMVTSSSDLGGTNLNTTITPATSTYYYYYDLGSEKQFTAEDSEIAYAAISGTDTLGGTLTSVTETLRLYVGLRFVLAYTDGTNWWFKSISGTGISTAPFTASTANYPTFQQAFSNSVVTTTAPSRLKSTYNDGSTQYCFNANLWTNMSAGQTCLLMAATRNDHPATKIQWWNGAVWVGQPSVNSNGVTTTANSTALVGSTTYTWPQGIASTATGGYTYSLAFANGLARNEKCWVINAKDSAVSGVQKYRFN